MLETVTDNGRWRKLKGFIQTLRRRPVHPAVHELRQPAGDPAPGSRRLPGSLEEQPDADGRCGCWTTWTAGLPREEAVRWLELILEAVVENYGEYIDYNSTTTQSDRGEMLYTLLDFLRLSASYDRVAWNLKPVVIAHEVLVRCGRNEAAEFGARRSPDAPPTMADDHLERFDD